MTHVNLLKDLGWGEEENKKKSGSLPEVHRSIPIPKGYSFWRKLFVFAGPGFMVAVGYMDPGNWATDLAGGAKFGYDLLFVILLSNCFAMLLQHLALKLGIVTGRDLAQMCRDTYSKKTAIFLWFMAEIMIIACDVAEVVGSAIALKLLFGIPLTAGIIITGFDVLIILMLQHKGFRYLEAVVVTLIATVTFSFIAELSLSGPGLVPILLGFIPHTKLIFDPHMLYLGIGILGATVMPHNLYLHSAIVQTRNYSETDKGKREAIRFSTIDSNMALCFALFVNGAILVVSAATFHLSGHSAVAGIEDAYKLFTPLLGSGMASILFGIGLLAAGQNSTITGTLAGQVIMEGFIHFKMKPWMRRLVTRGLAIVPAIFVIYLYGESGVTNLLILSQVVLSIQLSFAVFPLVMFTNSSKIMGNFANTKTTALFSWTVALLIALLNAWLVLSLL